MRPLLRALRTPATFLALAYQADPGTAVRGIALMVGGVVCLGLISIALKAWVNATVAQPGQIALIPVVVFALSLGIPTVVDRGMVYSGWTLRERFMGVLEKRLVELCATIPTVEHFERPDYLRELELLSLSRNALSGIVNAVTTNGSVVLRIVTLAFILAALHPALVVLPLGMAIPVFTETRARRRRLQLLDRLAEPMRRENYYVGLALAADAGREIRIFGLGHELLERFLALRRRINREMDHERIIGSLIGITGWLAFAIVYLAMLVFVAQLVSSGGATLGDMVVAITVALQMAFLAAQIAGSGPWLVESVKAGSRYNWLVDYAESVSTSITSGQRDPAPDALRTGITFDHVSFRYADSDRLALADVSVQLPAGAIVALVGDNGAGKTTLVKLLSRMYEPSAGRILVNGIDLRSLDVEAWRARLAAGFQDFMCFEFHAGEAIGVGHLPHINNEPALNAAVARAGATDVVRSLPDGLQTQLGRKFDGAELSRGQWQKVALARSMMRPAPLVLLLDEPTAALDAQAEYELFARHAEAARAAGHATGAITLLVTHRFSNVRMCDLIIVLSEGRLVECGSHQQLMTRGGLYSELYTLQASHYQ